MGRSELHDKRDVGTNPDRLFISLRLRHVLYVYALSLLFIGLLHQSHVDPDMISYVLIARHYAHGALKLAINGYWGPMISWMIAPLLALGLDGLIAARLVMGVCCLFYLGCCVHLFRTLNLSRERVIYLSAIAALYVTVRQHVFVMPDTLVGGFLILACARLVTDDRMTFRSHFWTGALLGLGYLAKAVALPVSLLLAPAHFVLRYVLGLLSLSQAFRATASVCTGVFVVAVPWIVTLSLHYGSPVISTTARVARIIVGPSPPDRFHPTWLILHHPESGRINSWEDPTNMPYLDWSPFESPQNFLFQTKFIWENVRVILDGLTDGDLLGLGIFAVLAAFLTPVPWRDRLCHERWRWSLLAVISMTVPYLPVYASSSRYFLPAYPFLLLCAVQCLAGASGQVKVHSRRAMLQRVAIHGVILLSFALPGLRSFISGVLPQNWEIRSTHREIAERIEAIGAAGPIAGVGTNNFGLVTSFFLKQAYYGQSKNASVTDLIEIGARLVYVPMDSQLEREIEADPHFRRLNEFLGDHRQQLDSWHLALYIRRE